MKKINLSLGALVLILQIYTPGAQAILIGGVDFPDGAQSFADRWISYNPGSGVSSDYDDPTQALGTPNFPTGNIAEGNGHVSLGSTGGSLVLQFVDNYLTTSGDADLDLWIFEVGPQVEPTFVDISTDALSWLSVGNVAGSTRGVDIDAYVNPGRYSYVRLTTERSFSGSPYAGPDIDAVGAISSIERQTRTPVPAPMTAALLSIGLLGVGLSGRRSQGRRESW